MIFIGDTNGVKALKSSQQKMDSLSTAQTQISETKSSNQTKSLLSESSKKSNSKSSTKMEMSTIFHQSSSCKPSRILKIAFDKPWQISQIVKSIGFPLKHVETSQSSRGLLALYFFSLANAIQMYNTLLKLDAVVNIKYLCDLSTFEHCDRAIFDNKFNLTEVNILRFLETLDKVVLLKKLSHRRYLVKFDSVCISDNIQRVMTQQFWQFDRRYYQSLICFTESNYDFVFISMTNPVRLKFCNMENKQKYRHLGQQIDFKAIIDEQDTRTTIMIKNIPNRIQKTDLIDLINKKFYGGYDFIYLPIDFKVRVTNLWRNVKRELVERNCIFGFEI